MPAPIRFKQLLVLVKPEVTYGVDPTPAAANAMMLSDVEIRPMEGQDVQRNIARPFFGAQESIPTGVHVVLTASFDLAGSGTAGTAPKWGPLVRALGCAEVISAGTKVEYQPITGGEESVATYFHIGPTRHVILGGAGTATLSFTAQGLPVGRLTLTGLFSMPTDQAMPTGIDWTGFQDPQVVTTANTSVFTIGGLSPVMRDFSLDIGNDVQTRMLVGVERVLIVDRNESISTTIEAVPMATYNPFQIALNRTKQVIALQHGTAAGRRIRLDVPIAQQKRPTGVSNAQGVVEWPLGFVPLPSGAGNDQWKLTIS